MPGVLKTVNTATPLAAGPRLVIPSWITVAQRGPVAPAHIFCAEHSDRRRPYRHFDAATGRELVVVQSVYDLEEEELVAVPAPELRRRTAGVPIDLVFPANAGLEFQSSLTGGSYTWLVAVYVSPAAITAAVNEIILTTIRSLGGVTSVCRINKPSSNRLNFTSFAGVSSVSPIVSSGHHLFVAVFDAGAGQQRVYHNSASAADTDSATDSGVPNSSDTINIGATGAGLNPWDASSGIFALAGWPAAIDTAHPAFFSQLMAAALADYDLD